MNLLGILRIRGIRNISKKNNLILNNLKLFYKHNFIIRKDEISLRKCLNKIEKFITWGEIDENLLNEIFIKKLRFSNKKKLFLGKNKSLNNFFFNFKNSFKNLNLNEKEKKLLISSIYSNDLLKEKFLLEIKKIFFNFKKNYFFKKFFRLNSPKGGYKCIKKPFHNKGDFGDRGKEINKLIFRMI